jgi:sugar transferase (PEP-CTERM/EpsH1 system associated)
MLVSRVPWPLEKGDKLRAYHQLRMLVKNHEVHLCCLSDKNFDAAAIEHLKNITPHIYVIRLSRFLIAWRLFRALFSDKPFQVHYFFQNAAATKIKNLIEKIKPDHIYCQLVRASEYVKHLHDYKKTLDYMDSLSSGQRRRIAGTSWWMKYFVREESRRLTAYENLIFDYFDHHTIISEQDRLLIYHADRNKIGVIPNGIDAEFFSERITTKKYDIAFTGNMSYPPNVDCALRLANEILPIIHKTHPKVTLLIAGANPVKSIQQLQCSTVKVTGWLEDIRDAYNESRVFMAPMRSGSGLQNKLLEAMCMKLPCVTSPLAANAMGAKHDDCMLIGETNEEFAALALVLLIELERAKVLAERGRKFASEKFNWEATTNDLVHLMMQ